MSRRRYAPPTILNVGVGIHDGPGWDVLWTRQGCRVLRNGYAFATMRRSTLPSTARRHTQVPPYEWDGSLFGVQGKRKSRRPHPSRGGDGGFGADAPGIPPSADGALNDRGFRAVRGAGISLTAASGSFARCDGRPEALPLDSAIF